MNKDKNQDGILFVVNVSQVKNLKSYLLSLIIIGLTLYFYKDINNVFYSILNSVNVSDENNIVSYILPIFLLIIVLKQIYNYFLIKNEVYYFEEERLKKVSGVFNTSKNFMEYYKIKDHQINIPFIYKFFKLSNGHFVTIDHSNRTLDIKGAKNLYENERVLRNKIEELKDKRKGSEISIV